LEDGFKEGMLSANFKLKIRKVKGETNYDSSSFEAPEEFDDDFRSQFNAENDPQKFLAPSRFKTTEKLQARLDFVEGKASPQAKAASTETPEDDAPMPSAEKTVAAKVETKRTKVEKEGTDDDGKDEVSRLIDSLNLDDDVPV